MPWFGAKYTADPVFSCCFVSCDKQRKLYKEYNPHNDTLVITSEYHFDDEKSPFIDGLFDEIIPFVLRLLLSVLAHME